MHVERCARRYVGKEFLCDMWTAWRKIEGLPLNGPGRGRYEEEYLGMRHGHDDVVV